VDNEQKDFTDKVEMLRKIEARLYEFIEKRNELAQGKWKEELERKQKEQQTRRRQERNEKAKREQDEKDEAKRRKNREKIEKQDNMVLFNGRKPMIRANKQTVKKKVDNNKKPNAEEEEFNKYVLNT